MEAHDHVELRDTIERAIRDALTPEPSPDRERIEFIRRAAIALRVEAYGFGTHVAYRNDSEAARAAADLWDELQRQGL